MAWAVEDKRGGRVFLVDFLNVVSCIGVVWLHANGAVWIFEDSRTWVGSWLLETLLYWPVPVFFMLSGITLLDYRKRYDTKTFMKKRVVKTFVPFLFWSVVSIFWAIHIVGNLPSDTKISALSMLDMIINCRGMMIYWFFPALFSVYLSIPILSLIEEEKRRRAFLYMSVYGFLTMGAIPFFLGMLGIGLNSGWISPICGGYLPYVLLGYVLWNTDFPRWKRYVIYLLGVVGWGMRFFGGWYLSAQAGVLDKTFDFYLNVPCVLQSVAVFVFFKQMDLSWLEKKFGNLLGKLSSLSFGVFLVHYYVLCFVPDWFRIDGGAWQWRAFGWLLVYSVTAGLVAVMKKIPVVSRLVP